jgi:predicted metal-dependent peptidase
MSNQDPGNTGSIISEEDGIKIAEKSGYNVKEGEAGEVDINIKDKWYSESNKLFNRLNNSMKAGSGKGKALLTTLFKIHKGEVNWKNIFRRYVSTALSTEIYHKIGNKKHLGKEYLKYSEKQLMDALENIVVLVDVSGSMSQENLERILTEINTIIFSKKVNKIKIAFFDDGVDKESVQTVKRGSRPWIPKNVSGGGTNFQKALDWVSEELNNRISLLVFFTDGYANMPKKPIYSNKFIWVIYNNPGFSNPFGKMINLS